jgi:hypothetical protein
LRELLANWWLMAQERSEPQNTTAGGSPKYRDVQDWLTANLWKKKNPQVRFCGFGF